jgi:hypothetical protein
MRKRVSASLSLMMVAKMFLYTKKTYVSEQSAMMIRSNMNWKKPKKVFPRTMLNWLTNGINHPHSLEMLGFKRALLAKEYLAA